MAEEDAMRMEAELGISGQQNSANSPITGGLKSPPFIWLVKAAMRRLIFDAFHPVDLPAICVGPVAMQRC